MLKKKQNLHPAAVIAFMKRQAGNGVCPSWFVASPQHWRIAGTTQQMCFQTTANLKQH
jgi:hypothetical protein